MNAFLRLARVEDGYLELERDDGIEEGKMICVWSIDGGFSGLDDAPCRDDWAMDLMFGRRDFCVGGIFV